MGSPPPDVGLVASYAAFDAGVPRDPRWNEDSKEFLVEHPECVCCGQDSEVVHHVVPVSVDRALEMVRKNWAAMCHRCHFTVGHLNWWVNYNKFFWRTVNLIRKSRRINLMENAMPVTPLPDTVPECHALIRELELENAEMRVRAEQTVGGFLNRNGTSIISIIVGILAAIGGGLAYTQSNKNSSQIEHVQQKLDPDKPDSIANRVNEVGSGVDDVKRELKRKKGPFGE